MITDPVRRILSDAVENPDAYKKGANRKILQANYETMLDELSRTLFSQPCVSRMNMRVKLNSITTRELSKIPSHLVDLLRSMTDNENLLYSKTYTDHSHETRKFCEEYLRPVLEIV